MFGAIVVLFFLPWLDTSPVRSARFRPIYRYLIVVLVASVIALGFVGARPPEGIWVVIGRVATAYYFLHFLVLLPLLGKLERPLPLPESIARAVVRQGTPGQARGQVAGPGRDREACGKAVVPLPRSAPLASTATTPGLPLAAAAVGPVALTPNSQASGIGDNPMASAANPMAAEEPPHQGAALSKPGL
jgi:cytochrome b/b6/petD-like protein